jgi:hypothetical protein
LLQSRGSAQALFTQISGDAQLIPHPPQLWGSATVSVQLPAQHVPSLSPAGAIQLSPFVLGSHDSSLQE